jgi:hypothetical protein
MLSPTHFAYSDESSFTTADNYGAISILNFKSEIKSQLQDEIYPLIYRLPNEYKSHHIRNEKYFNISKDIFNILFNYAGLDSLRIDTIIWATNDSRYPRNQTNSGEKLSVLYYLQLRDIFSKMWGQNTCWILYPDQQNQLNWDQLKEYLSFYSMRKFESTIFGRNHDISWLRENNIQFSIIDLIPVESCDEPFVCIADIFAGMAAYSHNKSQKLLEWLQYDADQFYVQRTGQMPLPFLEKTNLPSHEIWRNKYIKYVLDKCATRKYYVSIRGKRGLHTFRRKMPFNFYYSGNSK